MNEFQRWFSDRGDATHRLDYDLDASSTVVDVGGYHGDFAFNIYNKYQCEIHIFEPVREFYESIIKRFEGVDKVHVHPYGLSTATSQQDISLLGDSTSTHKASANTQRIQLKEIQGVLDDLSIDHINLIKINIEGEEFPLLFHCLKQGIVERMENIQVQFHEFVEHAHMQRNAIRKQLEETHSLTYDYTFVWENWQQRKDR